MRVIPGIGPLTRPFWEASARGRLAVQQCPRCGSLQHPPLPVCARCRASPLGWRELDPAGVLYAFTVVHHATHAAFADRVPYAAGLVDVAPGVRLIAGLRVEPARLRVGMALRAVFRDVADGVALIEFEEDPAARPL